MENTITILQQEPNWIISIIVGLILSIPFSLVTNLWSMKISYWNDKRKERISEKRKEQLRKNLDEVTQYKEEPQQFLILITNNCLNILLFLTMCFMIRVFMSVMGIPHLDNILCMILFMIFYKSFNKIIKSAEIYSNIRKYDSYKANIEQQINKDTQI